MKGIVRVVVAVLASLLLVTSAVARPTATFIPRSNLVVPPTAHILHGTYEDWAVAWWQWANGIPYEINPLVDTTGEDCGVGQSGPVWFLAGLWGFQGGSTERECTIPIGKFLFFPVANALWLTLPGDVDPPPDGYKGTLLAWYTKTREAWFAHNEEAIAENVLFLTDAEVDLVAEIDGVEVRNLSKYRIDRTDPFYVELPETSLWTGNGSLGHGLYGPAIDNGSTYLMLRPLKPGSHTLHLQWRVVIREWGIDLPYEVFYNLHVGRGK